MVWVIRMRLVLFNVGLGFDPFQLIGYVITRTTNRLGWNIGSIAQSFIQTRSSCFRLIQLNLTSKQLKTIWIDFALESEQPNRYGQHPFENHCSLIQSSTFKWCNELIRLNPVQNGGLIAVVMEQVGQVWSLQWSGTPEPERVSLHNRRRSGTFRFVFQTGDSGIETLLLLHIVPPMRWRVRGRSALFTRFVLPEPVGMHEGHRLRPEVFAGRHSPYEQSDVYGSQRLFEDISFDAELDHSAFIAAETAGSLLL